ncbi:MAG TPA: hypothetical protein PKD51_18985 [Saprospiraceae bacterium]|nr:hypothetical protein [Saprospiraceae bacterium]
MKYFFSVVMIIVASCSSSKMGQRGDKVSSNDLFTIGGNCQFKEGTGFDSKVGTVRCGDIIFDYDYGKYANAGPVTMEEGFMRAFNANYYAKFFEIIHIEAKLNRLFRDSVSIVNIVDKVEDTKTIFQCQVCTKVANLKFRGRTYGYPFQFNNEDPNLKYYDITMDTTDNYIRKIFISSIDSLPSGLYLRSVEGKKDGKILSIVTRNRVDSQNLRKLFASVKFK